MRGRRGSGDGEAGLIEDRGRGDGRGLDEGGRDERDRVSGARDDGRRDENDLLRRRVWGAARKDIMFRRNKADFADIDPLDHPCMHIRYLINQVLILLGDALSEDNDESMLAGRG